MLTHTNAEEEVSIFQSFTKTRNKFIVYKLFVSLTFCVDNEMVRRQFAEKANQVGPWIERQMDAVTAIGMGLQVRVHGTS